MARLSGYVLINGNSSFKFPEQNIEYRSVFTIIVLSVKGTYEHTGLSEWAVREGTACRYTYTLCVHILLCMHYILLIA